MCASHLVSKVHEVPCGHQPVAAVVPGAAQHQRPAVAARRVHLRHRRSHRQTRKLHQLLEAEAKRAHELVIQRRRVLCAQEGDARTSVCSGLARTRVRSTARHRRRHGSLVATRQRAGTQPLTQERRRANPRHHRGARCCCEHLFVARRARHVYTVEDSAARRQYRSLYRRCRPAPTQPALSPARCVLRAPASGKGLRACRNTISYTRDASSRQRAAPAHGLGSHARAAPLAPGPRPLLPLRRHARLPPPCPTCLARRRSRWC